MIGLTRFPLFWAAAGPVLLLSLHGAGAHPSGGAETGEHILERRVDFGELRLDPRNLVDSSLSRSDLPALGRRTDKKGVNSAMNAAWNRVVAGGPKKQAFAPSIQRTPSMGTQQQPEASAPLQRRHSSPKIRKRKIPYHGAFQPTPSPFEKDMQGSSHSPFQKNTQGSSHSPVEKSAQGPSHSPFEKYAQGPPPQSKTEREEGQYKSSKGRPGTPGPQRKNKSSGSSKSPQKLRRSIDVDEALEMLHRRGPPFEPKLPPGNGPPPGLPEPPDQHSPPPSPPTSPRPYTPRLPSFNPPPSRSKSRHLHRRYDQL